MPCDDCARAREESLRDEMSAKTNAELRAVLNGSPNVKKRRAARTELHNRHVTVTHYPERRTSR